MCYVRKENPNVLSKKIQKPEKKIEEKTSSQLNK